MASIYIIRNKINNKVYIGQTIQTLNIRFTAHKMASRIEDSKFYRAMRKYGEENFYIELLETVAIESLNDREKYWIKQYDSYYNGYNSTFGGDGTIKYDYDQIYRVWQEGKNRQEIAKMFDITPDTVSKILKNCYNISDADIKKRGYESLMNNSVEFIIQKWKDGLTIHQITSQYGGDSTTIKKILIDYGVTPEMIQKRNNENQMINSVENILKLWQQGLTITEISTYGGNKNTIKKVLIENGVTQEDILKRRNLHCNQNARPVVQLTLNDEYIQTYPSGRAATLALNKNSASINNCCHHKAKSAYGFHWLFLDEYNERLKNGTQQ